MEGEKLSSIQVSRTWKLFIGQSIHPIRNEGMGKEDVRGEFLLLPATSFTLLDYMRICCKIQVIIIHHLTKYNFRIVRKQLTFLITIEIHKRKIQSGHWDTNARMNTS